MASSWLPIFDEERLQKVLLLGTTWHHSILREAVENDFVIDVSICLTKISNLCNQINLYYMPEVQRYIVAA